ncbi:MAG: polysaccharide biosynthesis protein [Gammaproteobacteria bacterium]|nr:polysaccharide biosynthesis protein [Gammaproteobacteria bacterium]
MTKSTDGLSRLVSEVVHLPRQMKKAVMIIADGICLPSMLFLAISLRLGSMDHIYVLGAWPYAVALLTAFPVFIRLGLYRAIVRYVGGKAIRTVLTGVSLSTVMMFAVDYFLWNGDTIPYAALVIYWALALIYVTGSRVLVRYIVFSYGNKTQMREPVAIYGAGDAGAQLSSLLLTEGAFEPVAFFDDKHALQTGHINGLTVYPPSELQRVIDDYAIRRILLAMPAASRRRRQEILATIGSHGVRVQSMPELSDIVSGRSRIDELRDVDVNDLLGRDPVPPKPALFSSCIEGKSVMVTGAGGSIGSELCRQIMTQLPRRLVLFENSELALYAIDAELRQIAAREGFEVDILPLLGSVHHRQRVLEVMTTFGVQTVYHAAAYKHVPMVEHNMIEGLHNNVIGTWYAGEAALEAGVETFVLISTDKAVNPANIMGATKRFAELVLQGLQSRTARTRFSMVRFGNVLGSSGSVVPLFREQIRKGGPVTVTHRDVIRYFMTIPEAAQLVIQAGAMGKGGDVFVLDMGQPVRIDDLARRMINLMGLSVRDESDPEGDIEIQYTGLRTAEKLYEELLIGSNVTGTAHPRIMRAVEHSLPWERVRQLLEDLLIALGSFDCRRALARLTDAVVEYRPDSEIKDLVWVRRASVGQRSEAKVAVMPRRRITDYMPGREGGDAGT